MIWVRVLYFVAVWDNFLRRLFICPGSAINHWGAGNLCSPVGNCYWDNLHQSTAHRAFHKRPVMQAGFFCTFFRGNKTGLRETVSDKQEGKGDGKMAEAAQTPGHRTPLMPAKIAKNIIGAYPRR